MLDEVEERWQSLSIFLNEVSLMSNSNKYSGDGSKKPVDYLYNCVEDGIVFSDPAGRYQLKLVACCKKHGFENMKAIHHLFDELPDITKLEFCMSPLVFGQYYIDHQDDRSRFPEPAFSLREYVNYRDQTKFDQMMVDIHKDLGIE